MIRLRVSELFNQLFRDVLSIHDSGKRVREMGLGHSSGMTLEISNQLNHTLQYDHGQFNEIHGKVAIIILLVWPALKH